jgi:hypothetical protein
LKINDKHSPYFICHEYIKRREQHVQFLLSITMKFYSIRTAIAALLVFTVQALPVNPEITRFDWSPSAQLADQSFSIELQAPSRIHVTDSNPLSQGFSVYDNGNFVGETTDTRQGFFNLDQGLHLLSIKPKDISSRQGSGYIRIVPGKF